MQEMRIRAKAGSPIDGLMMILKPRNNKELGKMPLRGPLFELGGLRYES